MTIIKQVEEFKSDFDLFEDPNEKLEYIFDLGKGHKTLEEKEKNDQTYVHGCSSEAWLVCDCSNKLINFRGEGTSELAKGMLVMLLKIFNQRTADEILAFNPQELQKMGIIELLSPVRQQSLEAFLTKVYTYAKECKEKQS